MRDEKQLSQRQLAAAMARLKRLETTACFDPAQPESRPTPDQDKIFRDCPSIAHRYVLGGNQSGKSQLGARETAWVLTETHPYWSRPEEWGDEPLLIIVMGRTTKQIEETLWRKISSFLDPSDYKVQRTGGVIQKVTHTNGNAIIFLSHHSDSEAREKVQSFVAHYVWLDELPGSYKLIEELHRRVQARSGRFLATFTPKAINNDIRRMVDVAAPPYSQKYKLRAFDNPTYTEGQKESILASLITASEAYRKTILEGDWLTSDERVYYFNYDTMVEAPPNYQHSWRHLVCVDPALSSALGLTVWAEDPVSHIWYCVLAEYVKGVYIPQKLVEVVQEKTKIYNVIRRRSDPHEVWYIQTAAGMGINYEGVYKKNERKGELIKTLQQSLGSTIRIAPWCQDLVAELEECRWAESGEARIVNGPSYHLLDSAQYFTDNIPRPDGTPVGNTFHGWLYQANDERKKVAAKKQAKQQKIAEEVRRRQIRRASPGRSSRGGFRGWT